MLKLKIKTISDGETHEGSYVIRQGTIYNDISRDMCYHFLQVEGMKKQNNLCT